MQIQSSQDYQLYDFDHKQEINVSSTISLRQGIEKLKSYSQDLVYEVQYMYLALKKEDLNLTFQEVAQKTIQSQVHQSYENEEKQNNGGKFRFIVYAENKNKKIPKLKEKASEDEIIKAVLEFSSQLDIDENDFDAKASSYVQQAKQNLKKQKKQKKIKFIKFAKALKRRMITKTHTLNYPIQNILKSVEVPSSSFLPSLKMAQMSQQPKEHEKMAEEEAMCIQYQNHVKEIKKKNEVDQEEQGQSVDEQELKKQLGESQFNQEEKDLQIFIKNILENPKIFDSPKIKPQNTRNILWRTASKIVSFLEDTFDKATKKFQSWMDWLALQQKKIKQFIDVFKLSPKKKYSDYDPQFIFAILQSYMQNVAANMRSFVKGQGFRLYQYHQYAQGKIQTQHVIPWQIPNDYKIGIVGDYGTGQNDAKRLLRELIIQRKVNVIINLGDVYYSGTQNQYKTNIIEVLNELRKQADRQILYFQIPGNHDYYSGGKGFYKCIKDINSQYKDWKDKTQTASYFSLRSKDGKWQFLGMDSSYFQRSPINAINPCFQGTKLKYEQQKWHMDKLRNFSGSTILLSHHQLFSRHENITGKFTDVSLFMKDLRKVNSNLVSQMFSYYPYASSWFWGHQHSLMLFQDNNLGLQKPRLLGNSSFRQFEKKSPYSRYKQDPEFPLIGNDNKKYLIKYVPNKSIRKIQKLHKDLPHYYDLSYAVIELGQKLQIDYYSITPFEQYQLPNPYNGPIYSEKLETKDEIIKKKRTPINQNNNEVLVFSSIGCNIVCNNQSKQAGLSLTNKEKLIIQELNDKKGQNGNKIVYIKKILQGKIFYLTCNQLNKASFSENIYKTCEWELEIDDLFAGQHKSQSLRYFQSFKLKNGGFYLCASTPKVLSCIENLFGQSKQVSNKNPRYLMDNSYNSCLYGVDHPQKFDYLYNKFMFFKENIVR